MFDAFKKELSAHSSGGYHRVAGKLDRDAVVDWFHRRGLKPPANYTRFLCEIGAGSFFGGALTIYPLTSPQTRSVESELDRLREATGEDVFPIGYDETTESCYCFESQSGNEAVYWFSWQEKVKRLVAPSFSDWIEATPGELFREQVYAGYKQLTKVDELVAVMDERSAFRVRLVSYENQLRKPPDKPNDLLPRYNKVTLEVTKTKPVKIPVLTVMVARVGSKYGAANVEYATFPVQGIPVNVPTICDCFVFDPFNVPFTEITVIFNPVIDLGSKMRVKFKELSGLLV